MNSVGRSVGLIGDDPITYRLVEKLQSFARTNFPILITGETGVGKEVVARALHLLGGRSERSWVPINCAALPEALAESELFGHERGAFTGALSARPGAFEAANYGTLFLDEMGELPLFTQAKLLRAIETGEVRRVGSDRGRRIDVRLIAASNRDLWQESQQGTFRQDLYFRLAVCIVKIEPLRHRLGDIAPLAEYFLKQIGAQVGSKTLSLGALDKMHQYSWPGNVRELRNVLTRAAVIAQGSVIEARDLQFESESPAPTTGKAWYGRSWREIEREALLRELERNNWNRRATARVMGIALSTVKEKIRRYGLTPVTLMGQLSPPHR